MHCFKDFITHTKVVAIRIHCLHTFITYTKNEGTQMEMYMLDSGKITKSMGKEILHIKTVMYMKVDMLKA